MTVAYESVWNVTRLYNMLVQVPTKSCSNLVGHQEKPQLILIALLKNAAMGGGLRDSKFLQLLLPPVIADQWSEGSLHLGKQ